jgi:short-subunit dehydrogenase
LVNNAGLDVFNKYHLLKEEDIINTIIVDCIPQAILIRKLILKLSKRPHSAIINVSSVAGEIPCSYYNVYSAAKSFNNYLSQTLSYEYPNVDVNSLI